MAKTEKPLDKEAWIALLKELSKLRRWGYLAPKPHLHLEQGWREAGSSPFALPCEICSGDSLEYCRLNYNFIDLCKDHARQLRLIW